MEIIVRGVSNGIGCFVLGDKHKMGQFIWGGKSLCDVLSKVTYRNIHSIQDCLTLQEYLTSLGQWEGDWQMKFIVPSADPEGGTVKLTI